MSEPTPASWFILIAVVIVFATPAWANNFTIEIVAKDDTKTGADTVLVEVFVVNTSGVPQPFVAYQLDWPCTAPAQPGANGTVGAGMPEPVVPGPDAVVSIGEPTSVNGIPRLTDGDDIYAVNQTLCRVAVSNLLDGPAYLLVGATRYLGAIRYRVSNCATGAFTLKLEVPTNPKNPSGVDPTRFRPTATTLHPWTYGGHAALMIPVGSCCSGFTCEVDGVNQFCCEEGLTGFPNANQWHEGETCASPTACGCLTDAHCDNGQSCDGAETCNVATRQCQPGAPPDCPDGADPRCTNGFCDPAAKGGSGACVVQNKLNGTACTVDGEGNPQCDNPDTCENGVCRENRKPALTPCEKDPNPGDPHCDAPDTCDGAGNCNFNHQPDGFPCADDANECTLDICQSGTCSHVKLPDGTSCLDDGDAATTDICQGGQCTHGRITVTHEPNDRRPDRGCGGAAVDQVYAGDPAAATALDADVNGSGLLDRFIRRIVVSKDGAEIKSIEVWCVDQAFYAVRVRKGQRPDRQWLV